MSKNNIPIEKFTSQLGNYLIPTTIIFIILLVMIPFIDSSIESIWPYILMAGLAILIQILIKINVQEKIIFLALITIIIILFGAQFWFYFVIPDYYDYQPITNARLSMIYQLHGKIQVFYSPDYPKQGDIISGYISQCSNDYTKCIDIEEYFLTAFMYDNSRTKHIIINNNKHMKKTPFELTYMGFPINLEMKYNNQTYTFILPKKSFWQTFQTQFNRHPIYGLLSLIATILTIITIFKLSKIKKFFTKVKKIYAKDIKKILIYLQK
jgi:hypothetical protein